MMQKMWNNLQESLTESRFSFDNLDAAFYFGSMFWNDFSGTPQMTRAHEHAWYEFHCVKKGVLKVKTDKNTYLIHANEALFIPPHLYHITETVGDNTLYTCLGFELSKNGKNSEENLFGAMNATFSSAPCSKLKGCRAIADLCRTLLDYAISGGMPNSCRTHNMLTSFLFLLSDKLRDGKDANTPAPQINTHDNSDLRNYLLDYLTSNQIDNMTLAELSDKIYLNKKQINRIVKKRYHMTYKQKQIRFRIENAKKQLADSDLPIDRIALSVGYTNLTGFYKAFRRIVGETPGEYRKRSSDS